MTVSTKNKKSVLRALEGSGVKWVDSAPKELEEFIPTLKFLSFNYAGTNELSQTSVNQEIISGPEFVGHVWREMAKAKKPEYEIHNTDSGSSTMYAQYIQKEEVKPDDDFHPDDPADLRPGDLCYVGDALDEIKGHFNTKNIANIRIFSHIDCGEINFVMQNDIDEYDYKHGFEYDTVPFMYAKRTGERVERIEKKDPLDLPPVIGMEYEWNGKKVVFIEYGDSYIITVNGISMVRRCGASWILINENKTVRQYLSEYDI